MSITDPWIDTENNHLSAELAMPGYKVCSKDRLQNVDGGVMLYVTENPHVTR